MAELEGVAVVIGKREFIVPPMSVAVYEKVTTEQSGDTFEDALERVRVLLADNYPDLTVAELKALVRVKDLVKTATAVAKAASAGMELGEGEAGRP